MKNKKQTPKTQTDFRQLSTDKQIEALKGTRVERVFSFERDDIDEENRTVWLSISSERPYERWWGIEVLDHAPESIRFERLKQGAPLLVDHDRTDQVGVVEKFEITKENKLRVLARFGRSDRAQEIFQDVLDGIRKNTSVGYMINDLVLEKQEGDQSTYRVTDWEPFEGSIVSVPADPSVGVGRADNDNELKQKIEVIMKDNEKKTETKADAVEKVEKVETKQPTPDTEAIAQREAHRLAEINEIGERFSEYGADELARDMLKKNASLSVEAFREAVLEKVSAAQKPFETAQPADTRNTPHVEVVTRLPFNTGFKGMTLSNGQKMSGEEQAHRAGQWLLSVLGNQRSAQWCKENGVGYGERIMHSSDITAGGAVVPAEMEQAIIDLRDSYGVARRLARVRNMTSNVLDIPKRTGGLTTYYVQDSDDTAVTASDKSWGQVQLNTKKLAGLGVISNDTVEDAIIDAVNDLAEELAWAFAKAEDEAFIDGDGTSTYGGITGFRTLMANPTNYASGIDATSGDDQFSEIIQTDLNSVMGAIAAYAKPGAVWLCSETAKALVFDRLMAAAGGNTTVTLAGEVRPAFLGYPIITSEAMPSDTTALNNVVMLAFGNFQMSTSLGNRRGISIQVLREAYATKGQIGILGTERFDIVHHDLGDSTTKGPVATLTGNT